jgi:hypothetical protein
MRSKENKDTDVEETNSLNIPTGNRIFVSG